VVRVVRKNQIATGELVTRASSSSRRVAVELVPLPLWRKRKYRRFFYLVSAVRVGVVEVKKEGGREEREG
jgi:hypothetical protein